jgi:hypothetical protein
MTSDDSKTWYTVAAEFTYSFTHDAACACDCSIEPYLESVVEHLDGLAADDVTLVVDEDAKWFSLSVLVSAYEAESIESVVGKALGLLRTAFHACDVATPGWPTNNEAVRFKSVTVDMTTLSDDADPERVLVTA